MTCVMLGTVQSVSHVSNIKNVIWFQMVHVVLDSILNFASDK